jgi:hypothetical protein
MKTGIKWIELIIVISIISVIVIGYKQIAYKKQKHHETSRPQENQSYTSGTPTPYASTGRKSSEPKNIFFNTGGSHVVVLPWLPTPNDTINMGKGNCSIHIIPSPYDSTVFFQGKEVGKGPVKITGLSPGEYRLTASSSIYGIDEITVKVEKDLVYGLIDLTKKDK